MNSNEKMEFKKLPTHIAIIMDGNGRWAKKRGLPRIKGHEKGLEALNNIAKACSDIGIKYLSVYAFSTENWSRPDDEVSYLMSLPQKYLAEKEDELNKTQTKVVVTGRKDKMPKETKEAFDRIIDITKDHQGLVLNICFDYGTKYELVEAVKEIYQENIDFIDEEVIEKHLLTKGIPDVDLLIRTSGEKRISNYLLWQIAYAEIYFTDCLWPDFNEEELKKSLLDFESRDRRFGSI